MADQPITLTCRVEKGPRLQIRNRALLLAALKRWEGRDVDLSFALHREIRSLRQNAYLWGVCYRAVSEHTGYEDWEVHELAKQMFLPRTLAVTDGNGEIKGEYVIGGSTTKLDTAEMTEYIERFRRWAAETFGLVIPDPDGGY